MLEQYLEIARVNGKHNLLPHAAVAILLCAVAPFLMGVANLDEPQVAKIIELYLGFLGMILFIPLFLPDTNKDIRDLIASKKIPITVVRLVRLLEAFAILLVLLLTFLAMLKYNDCDFHFGRCFYVAVANCVGMGGVGLLFYSLVDNIAFAYMMPFLYYLISIGNKKFLGKLWLMGFSGGSLEEKKYILTVGICMMVAALLVREKSRM